MKCTLYKDLNLNNLITNLRRLVDLRCILIIIV